MKKNKVYRSVVVEAKFLCNNEERIIVIKTRVSTAKIGKSTLVTFATDVENMIKEKYGKPIDYRVIMGDRVIFTKSELDEYTRMIDRR